MEANTTTSVFDPRIPPQTDAPSLDHESASVSGGSPATVQSVVAGLNPEAPWFDLGPVSLDTTLLCASPHPPQGFFDAFGSPPPMHFGDFYLPPPSLASPFPAFNSYA
ncbi:hypothetical protein MY10362_009164 [Beauveria mimosiformis]